MNIQNLRMLVKQMDAGQFSRNRHFSAYQKPEVQEAKRCQSRLATLRRLFSATGSDGWVIALKKRRQGLWCLSCRSAKWKCSWAAYLKDFEMALLWEDPLVGKVLHSQAGPAATFT